MPLSTTVRNIELYRHIAATHAEQTGAVDPQLAERRLVKELATACSEGREEEAMLGLQLLSKHYGGDRAGGVPENLGRILREYNQRVEDTFSDEFLTQVDELIVEQRGRSLHRRQFDEAKADLTFGRRYPDDFLSEVMDPSPTHVGSIGGLIGSFVRVVGLGAIVGTPRTMARIAKGQRVAKTGTDLQRAIEFAHEEAWHEARHDGVSDERSLVTQHLLEHLESAVRQGRETEALEGLQLLSYHYGDDRTDGIPAELVDELNELAAQEESVFTADFAAHVEVLYRDQLTWPNAVRKFNARWAEETRDARYPLPPAPVVERHEVSGHG